ncbi:endonuclease domain-containing protein [Actinomadura opuntiae]|uniref:endonuclease domain-containing protein n=1 Tax=Actinomadura sp. OS1-43 TaxID=604315 RepID=UPI00255AB3E3|nr:endonuclease domain-containing protein [Actinomadura sp. OS1-43]MDL4817210.1 endonuclease domain-containing protein [Actinomadura sp. OS1-43]
MTDDAGFALCHVRGLGKPLTGPAVHALSVPRAQRCKRRSAWPGTGGSVRPIGPMLKDWPNDCPPGWYVWWTLFEDQHGLCALCTSPPHIIDHDHSTDLIRGLLCRACNSYEPFCCFPAYAASPPAGGRRWRYG